MAGVEGLSSEKDEDVIDAICAGMESMNTDDKYKQQQEQVKSSMVNFFQSLVSKKASDKKTNFEPEELKNIVGQIKGKNFLELLEKLPYFIFEDVNAQHNVIVFSAKRIREAGFYLGKEFLYSFTGIIKPELLPEGQCF